MGFFISSFVVFPTCFRMSASFVQSVVVGAGAVGLSAARVLARAGREVLLVDRASRAGTGTSARNSGVVHAGLYYERGSVKAATCVEGSWMLHRFCEIFSVPINKCGKLVVAMNKAQDAKLEILYMRALGLGARDIVLLPGEDALRFEPNLSPKTAGAIWSPHTATIDAAAFTEALLRDCQSIGGFGFSAKSEVVSVEHSRMDGLFTLEFADGTRIRCKELVNAAGLHAGQISKLLKVEGLPKISFFKGSYFSIKSIKSSPFQRLIYPVPSGAHLGIHTVIDPSGALRFGPDCVKVDEAFLGEATTAHSVDPTSAAQFREAISQYWPEVPEVGEFEPDFAGIRPRTDANDFAIEQHGIPGYVALYGIDSPGLTAALSLGHRVGDLLGVHGVVTPEMKSSHVYEWEA